METSGWKGESNTPPANLIFIEIKMNDIEWFQKERLTFLSFSKEVSMKPSSFKEFLSLFTARPKTLCKERRKA